MLVLDVGRSLKILSIYLPYLKPKEVADYLRAKIKWYQDSFLNFVCLETSNINHPNLQKVHQH